MNLIVILRFDGDDSAFHVLGWHVDENRKAQTMIVSFSEHPKNPKGQLQHLSKSLKISAFERLKNGALNLEKLRW